MRVNTPVPDDPVRHQHLDAATTYTNDPAEGQGSAPTRSRPRPVRGAALLRVVIWHATGAAVVTLVAAIPVMFFVSGQLFAGSARRRGQWPTVRDRLRRVGPPLWLFALGAWTAMFIASVATGTGLAWSRLIWWIVPLTDPVGSSWEGGWLATPLWYLRTLLWLLLLAPLVMRALQRSAVVVLGLGLALIVALEWAHRSRLWQPVFAPNALWQLGDLALYGVFFAAGMVAHTRPPTARPHRLLLAALALGIAIAVVWFVQPPLDGVVNNSHVLHLLVGGMWLSLAMAARRPLARIAATQTVRPAVEFLGQRSLTVYLWHTTAIVGALWLLGHAGLDTTGAGAPAYATLVVAATAAAVAATGWLEDLAARRRPRLWPSTGRSGHAANATAPGGAGGAGGSRAWLAPAMSVALLVSAVPLALAVTGERDEMSAFRPRVPSQAPPIPLLDAASVATAQPIELGPPVVDADALQQTVRDWAQGAGIQGASVAVAVPGGATWWGATGVDASGRRRDAETEIDTMSITKLFTANLVYRSIDAGLIGLDDPLPALDALPDNPLSGIVTVRQLLAHRSGLVNYRDTAAYHENPAVVGGPLDALLVSTADPGTVGPGETARYSSSNYIVLGFLLEQLTGVDYDGQLQSGLLDPLELTRTVHLPPGPGEPRFATGGLVSNITDLARAGEALLVDHVGISAESWAEMRAFDVEAGLGPGTMQFCPCRPGDDGLDTPMAFGYSGGHTLLVYLPVHDLVVAVDITDDFYGEQGHFEAIEALLPELAEAVRPRLDPPEILAS